jgi:hypothetical protein
MPVACIDCRQNKITIILFFVHSGGTAPAGSSGHGCVTVSIENDESCTVLQFSIEVQCSARTLYCTTRVEFRFAIQVPC